MDVFGDTDLGIVVGGAEGGEGGRLGWFLLPVRDVSIPPKKVDLDLP
jgi:hypothetical protein